MWRRSGLLIRGAAAKANATAALAGLRCALATRANAPRSDDNAVYNTRWFQFLLRAMRYNSQTSSDIRAAHAIVRSCVTRSENSTWLRVLPLGERSFQTVHQLLMVHVWLANKRVMYPLEGEGNRALQKEVFHVLWDNAERRLRAAGINELSISKHLGDVQRISLGGLYAYDKAFKEPSDAELKASLHRNLFAANQAVSTATLSMMAEWMRSEEQRIRALDEDSLRHGELRWTFPNGVVATAEDEEKEVARGAAGEWRSTMAVTGRTYWWNTRTRQSFWDKPRR